MGRGRRRWPQHSIRWVVALGLCALFSPGVGFAHTKFKPTDTKKKHTVHTVRRGETLRAIASSYGVDVRALIEANHLSRPDSLSVGQRLLIPGDRPAEPKSAAHRGSTAVHSVHPPAGLVLSRPDGGGNLPSLLWPLDGPVNSAFGRRRRGWHRGVDIKAEMGTPILAAAPGTVMFSGWERLYGRAVKVEHDHGFVTVYAHNLKIYVETGDRVAQGQVIATVGRTGRATTSHLHFEVRSNGQAFDPLFLLPEREFLPPSEVPVQVEGDDEGHE